MGVLEEFVGLSPSYGYECSLVDAAFVASRSPVVRQEGLIGGMWSPSELCVFPRQVVAELPSYLRSLGVSFLFGTAVTSVSQGFLVAGGEEVRAERIYVCSGDDFETLLPSLFASLGIDRCKLQMLRMRPRSPGFDIGTHLCAGLTLGHYANFSVCDRLASVRERFAQDLPEYVQWGIHLLVSQHEDGCLTVGDSHEYGLAPSPFLSEHIEALIMAYLDTFLPLAELEVIERWHGVYAKHPSRPYVVEQPLPGVTVVTAPGGAGMTLSFGLAEKVCLQAA
jgi:FAD dependent oxidoreductase TIGR03364